LLTEKPHPFRSVDHQHSGVQRVKTIVRFLNDESGATAIEYGLIAALVAVGAIAATTLLGNGLAGLFNGIGGKLENQTDLI